MCLAIPGKLVECDSADAGMDRSGTIEFSGVRQKVSLAYVPKASVDDYVLVHAGFAIETIDEEEAQRLLGYLSEMEDALGEP